MKNTKNKNKPIRYKKKLKDITFEITNWLRFIKLNTIISYRNERDFIKEGKVEVIDPEDNHDMKYKVVYGKAWGDFDWIGDKDVIRVIEKGKCQKK